MNKILKLEGNKCDTSTEAIKINNKCLLLIQGFKTFPDLILMSRGVSRQGGRIA
jgi:hypothetical protein